MSNYAQPLVTQLHNAISHRMSQSACVAEIEHAMACVTVLSGSTEIVKPGRIMGFQSELLIDAKN
jgi:hypothetical protein